MAENKILKSDISEKDVFKYITESAEKSMVIIDGYNAKLNETANAIANISKSADTSTLKGINDILKAVKELTNLKNTAVKNDNTKNKIQAEVKAYEQLLVEIKKKEDAENKLAQTEAKNHAQREKQYNKEIKDAEKLAQAQEKQYNKEIKDAEKLAQTEAKNHAQREKQYNKEIQQAEKASSVYSRVDKKLSDMVKRYRDLAIRKELGAKLTDKEAKDMDFLAQKIQKYDTALKNVDASSGKFQRNVGNYKSTFDGMTFSVTQLAREMPAFANSVQTGFMAISNNLPMFFDEIQKLKQANIELVKSGEAPKSVFKSLASSILSTQVLLSVGVTLLTLYGAKLVEWGSSLFKVNKGLDEHAQKQAYINKQRKESSEAIAQESAEFIGNINALRMSNANSKERSRMISEINEKYGTTLKNLKDEKDFTNQLNVAVGTYLELQVEKYRQQQNEQKIITNLQTQDKLRYDTQKRQKELNKLKKEEIILNQQAESMAKRVGVAPQALELMYNRIKKNTEAQKENSDAIKSNNKELDEAEKRLLTYDVAVTVDTKTTDKSTKSKKQYRTEIEYTNDYISQQIELLKELQDLENQRLSDLQQQNINDVYANMMKRVTETGQLEVDELERLINEKTAQDIKYLEAKTNTEIQQLEFVYDAEMKLRRANLDAKYRDLLDQKNLPQDKRLEIESNYQKALSELDKEEQKRYEDLQSKKVIIAEKAKREATQIEKQGNEEINQKNDELIQAQIEFYKHQNDIRKEELEKEKKIAEERKKIAKDVRDTLERYGEELIQREIDRSKRKQDLMQKESDRAKEREQQLRELANNGNATASQSLALAEAQSLKRQQAIDREAKKQQAWETAKIAYKAVFDFMEKGDSLPIATLKGATGTMSMQALFKSLFGFRKGTKRTVGEELGTKFSSGEDGYLARVDAREKIINPELAGMTGSATTDEIVDGFLNFQKLNSGLIVPITARQEQQKPDVLAKKLDELTNVVKSKPEFSMHPDIVMGIVKGITTEEKRGIVRNRTKFRS